MIIKEAKSDNANDIKYILKITWKETYGYLFTPEQMARVSDVWHSKELILKEIARGKGKTLLAEIDDKKIGLISYLRDNDIVHIKRLYVLPEFQRLGTGAKLLEACMDEEKSMTSFIVEVEKNNKRAISFYEKHNFLVCGSNVMKLEGINIESLILEKRSI